MASVVGAGDMEFEGSSIIPGSCFGCTEINFSRLYAAFGSPVTVPAEVSVDGPEWTVRELPDWAEGSPPAGTEAFDMAGDTIGAGDDLPCEPVKMGWRGTTGLGLRRGAGCGWTLGLMASPSFERALLMCSSLPCQRSSSDGKKVSPDIIPGWNPKVVVGLASQSGELAVEWEKVQHTMTHSASCHLRSSSSGSIQRVQTSCAY